MKKIIKNSIKKILEKVGYEIKRIDRGHDAQSGIYDEDGFYSVHNHDFMNDPSFINAYQRGTKATGKDYNWHWRVHTGLWVAETASKLDGDFIECGVNYGFLSSAIMQYLNWDKLNKSFFLLDTFNGLDKRYISDEELEAGVLEKGLERIENGFYVIGDGIEIVKNNFSEWKNLKIIQGPIPETLSQVESKKIAYLHIDLNCSDPEVASAEYFWPFIVDGGFILLDDYAYFDFDLSKKGMDKFAKSKNINILSLPTGQGLIIKPPK